ncbi:MAG: dihydroorotase [Deltaproteobacteria bacterium]|nr:dihydroorotase [Deltaproteobacteria bacterium]MBW2043698.1 dihydroorotase [Deltaproteobacteria bacterium]MBW2299840.1 dihydroorotase [Deltaproteobacteria bacterium]
MKADMAVRGGVVATPHGSFQADILVKEGKISALVKAHDIEAKQVIDASGLLVMPGAVDGHVHMMDPGHTEREDFITGTSAAAVGGATTVIEHHRTEPPVLNARIFQEKRDYLESRSLVDFSLMGGAVPDNLNELKNMWELGAVAFKTFTCALHGVVPMPAGNLRELFRTLAKFGGTTLIHAEDDSILRVNEELLRHSGRKDYLTVSEWRSEDAELVAISTATSLAAREGASAVFAHVSLPESLEVIQQARLQGAQIYAESCPQYFYLSHNDLLEKGPWAKFAPAVRNAETAHKMWDELEAGRISIVSTDHCPFPKSEKAAGIENIWDAPFGIPGIETTLRLMLNGVNKGLVSLERVVKALCEMPARIYGLYPRKGCLLPGSDADVLLIDLKGKDRISNQEIVSKCGWTPYDGMEVQGRIVTTIVRGKVVAENAKPVAERGYGQFIPRLDATKD